MILIETHEAPVISVKRLGPEIFELLIERNDLSFKPGQACSFISPDGKTLRSFSIASGLSEDKFRFVIRQVPEGLSSWLAERKIGDRIKFRGPFGLFAPGGHDSGGPYIYVATGTGITPLLSVWRSTPENPPAQLLYGLKSLQNAIDLPGLQSWCDTRVALSREPLPGHHHGRVTELLDAAPRGPDTHFYLCGLDAMLRQVQDRLLEMGVEKEKIHTEIFFRIAP